VSVLLGSGTGTFGTQVAYAVGTTVYCLTVGDFNGDGNPDLAALDNGTSTISVLLDSVTQTATAVAASVAIPGTGTAHLVDASYPGNTNFASSVSTTTSLTSTTPTTPKASASSSSRPPRRIASRPKCSPRNPCRHRKSP